MNASLPIIKISTIYLLLLQKEQIKSTPSPTLALTSTSSKFSNIKIEHADHLYFHGEETYKTTGSQTWRVDETLYSKLHHSRILNENWYIYYKWGPEWHINGDWINGNPYPHPFNDKNLPLTYTYYNLDFVRKKHLEIGRAHV